MKHNLLQICKMAIIILLVLCLTSCGYKDIDKRAFVVSIGIDKAKNDDKKYKVMMKIAIPSPDVRAEKPQFIIPQIESDSISDAVRMIKSKVHLELDFSHAKAIIFGEKVLGEDIEKVLDWFIRRRDIQKIAWVGIGKPNAEEVIALKRSSERLPSNAIFLSFGNSGTESAYIISEYLFDFRKRITEKGLDPVLPILEVKENKYFEINKATVFDKEQTRMTLSEEETKILNILLNRVQTVEISVENDEKESSFFIAADVAEANYEIKSNNNHKPVVHINLNFEGIIEETLDEMSEEELKECNEIAEKQFKEKVINLVKKLQKEKLDPIGFGLQYRANHFNEEDWEEWQSIYPDVAFEVTVDVTLQGTGLLQ